MTELILNPHARLVAQERGAAPDARAPAYSVRAPLRGRPLRPELVGADHPAFAALDALARARGDGDLELELDDDVERELVRLGVLAAPADIPERPTPSCALDDLAPPSTARPPTADAELRVAESLVLQVGPELPPATTARGERFVPTELTSRASRATPIAWIEDPTTGASVPYALDAKHAANELVPGGTPPKTTPEALTQLVHAGIVSLAGQHDRGDATRDESLRRAMRTEGFCATRDWLPPLHLSLLQRYYRELVDRGFVERFANESGEIRFVEYEEPLGRFWLEALTPLAVRVFDRPIRPSYAFFSSYVNGSTLPWHRDRPGCEYSATMLIEYTPTPDDGQSPWPLLIEGRDGAVRRLHQRPGDVVLFLGRELRHARDALAPGHRSTHLFFHWVD